MRAGAARKLIQLGLSASILGALSCAPPASIATFAESADHAIAAGTPLFADIHDSCVRRQAEEARLLPRYPHAGRNATDTAAESVCASFVPEVKELENVSSVLSAYFRAMHELAAFDETKVSAGAEQAGANVGTAAILSLNQVDSVAKLSGLITRALTHHYQRSKLQELLGEADPHVTAVSQALETVLVKDYGSLLDEEARALDRQYMGVSGTRDTATILLLNRAYAEDLEALNRRRAAARAYAAALQQVREGHHQLANGVGRLKNKEISLVLQPYISQLQALLRSVQTQP